MALTNDEIRVRELARTLARLCKGVPRAIAVSALCAALHIIIAIHYGEAVGARWIEKLDDMVNSIIAEFGGNGSVN